MVHQSYPAPPINPLQRIHVYNSLMMNAERWQLAHEYHRHRQNVHYQSLNEPGIVCGLGVRVIAALPSINEQSLQISNAGGIVLVEGDLSAAWELNYSSKNKCH